LQGCASNVDIALDAVSQQVRCGQQCTDRGAVVRWPTLLAPAPRDQISVFVLFAARADQQPRVFRRAPGAVPLPGDRVP
ncbi:MAG: hypothetical protein AAF098_08705, partial [Pseudomonadota bacterium]